MTVDRSHLKATIAAMLDALADEHMLGHQGAYARRFRLATRSGKRIELMFEQSPKTLANLWIEGCIAAALATSGIKQRLSPGSALYTTPGKSGAPQYGRHGALEKMPILSMADLICLQPETLAEAGDIMDRLLAV